MQDFFGNELHIGDDVLACSKVSNTDVYIGEYQIVGFTESRVQLERYSNGQPEIRSPNNLCLYSSATETKHFLVDDSKGESIDAGDPVICARNVEGKLVWGRGRAVEYDGQFLKIADADSNDFFYIMPKRVLTTKSH